MALHFYNECMKWTSIKFCVQVILVILTFIVYSSISVSRGVITFYLWP